MTKAALDTTWIAFCEDMIARLRNEPDEPETVILPVEASLAKEMTDGMEDNRIVMTALGYARSCRLSRCRRARTCSGSHPPEKDTPHVRHGSTVEVDAFRLLLPCIFNRSRYFRYCIDLERLGKVLDEIMASGKQDDHRWPLILL